MQKSFPDLQYAAKKRLTRRDRFLAEIDLATPWGKLHSEPDTASHALSIVPFPIFLAPKVWAITAKPDSGSSS